MLILHGAFTELHLQPVYVQPARLEPAQIERLAEGFCPMPTDEGPHAGQEVRLLRRGQWAICPHRFGGRLGYDGWRIVHAEESEG